MTEERPTPRAAERTAPTMRAMAQDRYGDPAEVLSLVEVPVPEVGPETVLVRVEAISLNAYDWHMVAASPSFIRLAGAGFSKPKHPIAGADLAGVVEAVGDAVTEFAPGDRVVGWHAGTAAEYVAATERTLVPVPKDVDLHQAAAVPMAGMTALQGLRDHGGVDAGSNVLILGASGGVGQFVVQIAKALGARVTGVCGTHNVETVRALGADRVVDYSTTDVHSLGDRFDVVVHVGGEYPLRKLRPIMTDDGTLVLVGSDEGGSLLGPARFLFGQVVRSWFTSQSVAQFTATNRKADLEVLVGMLADGTLRVAIDHVSPLAETGREIAYLREGHARGKVIIEVGA
ncbi:MAG: NAD(P)-dependent alcohol dehydrogenase [Acidimicrobiia bacterium]